MRWLFALVPPADAVVVHGWRDGEENSLRVVGELSRRVAVGCRLTLLCEDVVDARAQLEIALQHTAWRADRVEIVAKNSLAGVARYVRAALVFSTHGLFGNPKPDGRRVHVLLGHGHGPKSAYSPLRQTRHYAQVATTNNAVWGGAVLSDQGIAPDAVAVTGNPRDDAFWEPATRAGLERLGVDPNRPILLWLPTYRVPRNAPETSALAEIATNAELLERVAALGAAAARHGVTIVTKAHQLDDPASAEAWGFRVITAEGLRSIGMSFFQLLAIADGLVSDYSSVWVDFLVRRRPVGLLFVDDVEFAVGRGFNEPPIRRVARELVLDSDADIERLLAAVSSSFLEPVADASTMRVGARLELRSEPGAARRTVDLVAERLTACGSRIDLRVASPAGS